MLIEPEFQKLMQHRHTIPPVLAYRNTLYDMTVALSTVALRQFTILSKLTDTMLPL